jgi:hypothetical protein
LLMASTSALLKSYTQTGSEIDRIVGQVNSILCRRVESIRSSAAPPRTTVL